MNGVVFTHEAAKRIADVVRAYENSHPPAFQSFPQMGAGLHQSVFLGIAQEAIAANTSGDFCFASGTQGSETAFGDTYSGYYRTAADAGDIPTDAYVYVVSINGAWELTPVLCPDP